MSKANKRCPVGDCTKLTNTCGLCHMHYWRLRHYGDVNHTKTFIRKRCCIEGCENWSRKRGWCSKHYHRWQAHGDPTFIGQPHEKHGMAHFPEYTVWSGMKDRCYRPNSSAYRLYGKRGIKICQRWHSSFAAFYGDMGPRPTDQHSINRINNDGNYSCGKCEECLAKGWPANCEWATRTQQAINNRRYSNNTSGYRGVSRGNGAWVAYIDQENKRHWLGTFTSATEAAIAYNTVALEYYGDDAYLNELPDTA